MRLEMVGDQEEGMGVEEVEILSATVLRNQYGAPQDFNYNCDKNHTFLWHIINAEVLAILTIRYTDTLSG